MNINHHQTNTLKSPQQFERANKIVASFREKLREVSAKQGEEKRQNKPFVTMRMANKDGAFARNVTPEFQPALQKMVMEA